MEAKFTPGEWAIEGAMNSDTIRIGPKADHGRLGSWIEKPVAVVTMPTTATTCDPTDMRWTIDEESHANARLISAAPDLYAACKALVKWMVDSGHAHTPAGGVGAFKYEGTEYSVVTDARAALAKAEGSPCDA